MLLGKLHPKDPLREDIEEIVEAGKRSAALTRQLLAFSRKQTLQPKILDLNAVTESLQNMLRRLIGEDVELRLALAAGLAPVKADPGQIEQVIMNLAINAKDAMPEGGQLVIETRNVDLDASYASEHTEVVPGRYVLLAVTDTGSGMDRVTLTRVFEPFFTTKEMGKGTGLGLSTVYGIVAQSGGHIWAYSEPGRGTTFKVYLPEVGTESEPPEEDVQSVSIASPGGSRILVVEDETALRNLLDGMLTVLRYEVTTAANGGEALLLVEEQGLRPDLLLTDVVMPGMSGSILANRLRQRIPDLKVLYMSGYTDDAIVQHGVLEPGTPFIQKPMSLAGLSEKVKEVLRTTVENGRA